MKAFLAVWLVGMVACSPVSGPESGGDGNAGGGSDASGGGNGTGGNGTGVDSGATGDPGGSIAPVTFTSGTRIKARTTTTTMSTADGARYAFTQFVGWFDSQRNEECAPAVASDGITRCLPVASAINDTFFDDAACTIPLAIASAPGCFTTPRQYVTQPLAAPACTNAGARVFAAGATHPTYYSKSGTTCTGPSTLPGYTWYAASGSELAPTLFAAMTMTTTTL